MTREEKIAAIRSRQSQGVSREDKIAAIRSRQTQKPQENTFTEDLIGGARAIGSGLTLGFGDEIEAGIRTLSGDETYEEEKNKIREEQAKYSDENPWWSGGLELGGGLVSAIGTGGLGAAAKGASALAKVGRVAGLGALEGGIAGAGYSEEETLPEIAKDVALGAGLGGGLGVAGQGVGKVFKKAIGGNRIKTPLMTPEGVPIPINMVDEKGLVKSLYRDIVHNSFGGTLAKQGDEYAEAVLPGLKREVAETERAFDLEGAEAERAIDRLARESSDKAKGVSSNRLKKATAKREEAINQAKIERDARLAAGIEESPEIKAGKFETEGIGAVEESSLRDKVARESITPHASDAEISKIMSMTDRQMQLAALEKLNRKHGFKQVTSKTFKDFDHAPIVKRIKAELDDGALDDYQTEIVGLLENKLVKKVGDDGSISGKDLLEARNAIARLQNKTGVTSGGDRVHREALRRAKHKLDEEIKSRLSKKDVDLYVKEMKTYGNQNVYGKAIEYAERLDGQFSPQQLIKAGGKRRVARKQAPFQSEATAIRDATTAQKKAIQEAIDADKLRVAEETAAEKLRMSSLEGKEKARLSQATEKAKRRLKQTASRDRAVREGRLKRAKEAQEGAKRLRKNAPKSIDEFDSGYGSKKDRVAFIEKELKRDPSLFLKLLGTSALGATLGPAGSIGGVTLARILSHPKIQRIVAGQAKLSDVAGRNANVFSTALRRGAVYPQLENRR